MRIYLAQSKPVIGDLEHNYRLISQHYEHGLKLECGFCVLPELFLSGYTPADLLLKPSFIEEVTSYVNKLALSSKETVLLLPTPWQEDGKLYNAVLALQNGNIIGKTYKHDLPNYGIFDEKRYFTSGEPTIIEAHGMKVGVPICEDVWHDSVMMGLKRAGAELFIVPNASPFEIGKFSRRADVIKQRWQEVKSPIIYCNQVLGLDGIIYDGRSFGFDGEMKFALPSFAEAAQVVEIENGGINPANINNYSEMDLIYGAMVLGLRDYMQHNGFKSVILGLSGGVDSALVAAIAADSLGAENVTAVMLPSPFTSANSFDDAHALLRLLPKTHSKTINISAMLEAAIGSMEKLSPVAYENLQARIRAVMLMSIANTDNSLLLTTGNKSEMATGYCTIYGDMCGAFNPIKDLYKTQVWDICRWRNENIPSAVDVYNPVAPVIPEQIITKAPTAELRHDQKDSDSLPEYSLLDEILQLYLEHDLSAKEIIASGFDADAVNKVVKLIRMSEHKRWQAAPGVKINKRSFIKERRYPISSGCLI